MERCVPDAVLRVEKPEMNKHHSYLQGGLRLDRERASGVKQPWRYTLMGGAARKTVE